MIKGTKTIDAKLLTSIGTYWLFRLAEIHDIRLSDRSESHASPITRMISSVGRLSLFDNNDDTSPESLLSREFEYLINSIVQHESSLRQSVFEKYDLNTLNEYMDSGKFEIELKELEGLRDSDLKYIEQYLIKQFHF